MDTGNYMANQMDDLITAGIMQKDLQDGNELIARFMEVNSEVRKYTNNPDDKGVLLFFYPIANTKQAYLKSVEEMQYHFNWSWLMPVVYKIESMGYQINIVENTCCITDTEGYYKEGTFDWVGMESISIREDNKLHSVYEAIIQFILWYNTQKQ